jgi:hypothetical protein
VNRREELSLAARAGVDESALHSYVQAVVTSFQVCKLQTIIPDEEASNLRKPAGSIGEIG